MLLPTLLPHAAVPALDSGPVIVADRGGLPAISGYPARMPTYDFICVDCGEGFALDVPETPEEGSTRCPRCDSGHVRQTFASYLRNALSDPCKPDLEELRNCHFG